MTLNKAIEILIINNDHNPNFTDADRHNAHDLALEATKQLQAIRKAHPEFQTFLLPGETKED